MMAMPTEHPLTLVHPPSPIAAQGTRPTDSEDTTPHIETRQLTVHFGKAMAIRDVSLVIPRRRVTAIIGPSGCGKSTFLRALNRMHDIVPGARVTGEALLDGEEIAGMDAVQLRRRVGMVFQKPNPFPTMSIYDNVVAGLRFNGVRKRARLDEAVEQSLQRSALWDEVKDRLKNPAVSLSGGQQQRLCIARALAVEPEVILMDEPTSALDPIATARIEELLFELKQRFTIAIVTHNMQQAARVSDITAFMFMGNLVEADNTTVVFSQPKNKQTEDYITGRFG